MMRLAAILALPFFLAGCVGEGPPQPHSRIAPRCLPVDKIISRRPEGASRIYFEMIDGIDYRNELARPCQALRRASNLDVIAVELHGSEVCSGDQFRVVDPAQARVAGVASFPACRLGTFEAVR